MTTAEQAAAAFGGRVLRLIKARENEVYEVELPASRAALRLHRPGYQSADAIRSELWWCGAMADRDLPVPRPLLTTQGEPVVTVGNRAASAVKWLDGRPIGEAGVPLAGGELTQAALHRDLGRLIARMQSESASLTPPPWFTRPRWDLDGLLGETPFWGRFWDHPALTREEAELARQTRHFLHDRIADHAQRNSACLIHADVLRENVFTGPDGLALIDFDDSGWGYPLYDLGTALSQCLAEPALPAIAQALIAGYGETQPVEPGMVQVFTLMRCCASVGWTMPRLASSDPINRRHIVRMTRLAETVLSGGSPW